MRNGTYYMNNSGSKWVEFENGKRVKQEFETKTGQKVTRTVNYYSAFGNFATCNISWRGRKINVFPDTLLDDL